MAKTIGFRPAPGNNSRMAHTDYVEFERLLSHARALTDAAEAHGTLAGALCAADIYRLEDWLGEILPEGTTDLLSAESLRGVYELTARELRAGEMSFEMLLPEDDRPLDERATALGLWCQGFLYGLGTSPIRDLSGLGGDAGDIVRDLTEITQVGVDKKESLESNEAAYAELVEFVRVGVQLLFEELAQFRSPPPSTTESLH